MDCLTNRIGIQGCGAPFTTAVPASDGPPPVAAVEGLPVLLVNSLPGVSIRSIEALVDDEQVTYLNLWKDVVLRTMKKFEALVKAEINKCYRITDKAVISCIVCENKELFDVPLWYLHGCELMIERTSTDQLNRYTTIDLEKAEQLKADFYFEFQSALKNAVQSMNLDGSDCIECDLVPDLAVKFVFSTA